MSNIIPAKLIDRAEREGACEEAIKWLRAKPRTFRQLVRTNDDWAWWAITSFAPQKVRDRYLKAERALDLNSDNLLQDYHRIMLEALESAFCKK